MQWQKEEFGFSKCQGGGLAEEVQKLETCTTEQERVFIDKGLWEPQLTGERMSEMLQEQLNTWDNTVEGEVIE